MKKLCVLPAIALALAGLLFTACPDGNGGGGGPGGGPGGSVSTAGLEAAIQTAYDAKYGVKEAASADEVAKGRTWVTTAEMKALNDAIDAAETVRDSATTQAVVDAEKAQLEGATTTFNNAKKQGTATAITLSGTITIKNNGQPVPYVHIQLHDKDWAWREETRLSTSAANSQWSIITKPLDVETEIFFRISGYQNELYREPLFDIQVKDLSKSVQNTDISNINIDLANLKLITLSGTIKVSYDGKPIPSLSIEAYRYEDGFYLGGTPYMFLVGNNTPWSIKIEALDKDTAIRFRIVGSNHVWDVWSEDDRLFALWEYDANVTIKDKNISNVALNLGEMGEGGGTFTLTGIPAEHNGEWAMLEAGYEDQTLYIIGAQNINYSAGTYTGVLISGGSVSIPLWSIADDDTVTRYSGNNTNVKVFVYIINTASPPSGDLRDYLTAGISFDSVTFSNGSATRTWSQGEIEAD